MDPALIIAQKVSEINILSDNGPQRALELPIELLEQIFGIAAHGSPWDEKRKYLSVSKITYRSVSREVYRVIQVTQGSHSSFASEDKFRAFASWVESKPLAFVQTVIQALHLNLDGPGQDSKVWCRLLQKLTSLKMLHIYCAHWSDADGCLSTVWDCLFRLPSLKRLHVDWHMNSLAIPSAQESPVHALRNITHLSIVPEYLRSFKLDFLLHFEVLIHLMIFNPDIDYTKGDILGFEAGLPQLLSLLLVFTGAEDGSDWLFSQSEKIVTIHQPYHPFTDEFQLEANDGYSIWKQGENILAKRFQAGFHQNPPSL
ncbi:hypothetical protein DL96DRAFT_520905 [Flagelloscypha sp. PMI_526]|nr:hypothetical protein DL96DRAFT_520905 [Flagelloscypha sp. PMI_526]